MMAQTRNDRFEPVIGAADALGEPACALGRTDIDDEIDVAPVDAEIERRGCTPRRAACQQPWLPRPCGAAPHRASRDEAQWPDLHRCNATARETASRPANVC